jgi:phospholipid/cholesterol/gamma-HCH transport system substrate-binding protein
VNISNETKVGIVATFAIVIMIFGINFLKGTNIFSSNITYYARFKDVTGLATSNPVVLYGVKVGQVDELHFLPFNPHDTIISNTLDSSIRILTAQAIKEQDSGLRNRLNHEIVKLKDSSNQYKLRVQVKFHVSGSVDFPSNSVVKIKSELLAGKSLEIIPGSSKTYARKNDILKGAVELTLPEELNQTVAPIKNKVEALVTSIDTVVTSLNEIFNEKTKRDLRNAFASIGPTIQNIESTTLNISTFLSSEQARFHNILLNIDKIGQNVANYNASLTRIIDNVASMTDTVRAMNIKKTITELNNTLASVNDLLVNVKSGKGTIGKLVNDDKLYYDLVSATRNFDKLIYDFKSNPNKYLAPLGRRPRNPEPYKKDTAR